MLVALHIRELHFQAPVNFDPERARHTMALRLRAWEDLNADNEMLEKDVRILAIEVDQMIVIHQRKRSFQPLRPAETFDFNSDYLSRRGTTLTSCVPLVTLLKMIKESMNEPHLVTFIVSELIILSLILSHSKLSLV